MKVLITGTRGQLGKALIQLKPLGINIIPTTREEFNLENLEQCKKFLINNSRYNTNFQVFFTF